GPEGKECLAVRGEGGRMPGSLAAREPVPQLAGGSVPDTGRAVVVGAGNPPAVRREGDGGDWPGMAQPMRADAGKHPLRQGRFYLGRRGRRLTLRRYGRRLLCLGRNGVLRWPSQDHQPDTGSEQTGGESAGERTA